MSTKNRSIRPIVIMGFTIIFLTFGVFGGWAAVAKLDALSPLKVLGRGYAMARTQDGGILRSSDQVQPGDRIRLRLAQGTLGCRVEEKEDNHGEKEL